MHYAQNNVAAKAEIKGSGSGFLNLITLLDWTPSLPSYRSWLRKKAGTRFDEPINP